MNIVNLNLAYGSSQLILLTQTWKDTHTLIEIVLFFNY